MKILYTLFCFLLFISCKKKDTHYWLNDEEKSVYNIYNVGEQFQLKEESTGDIFTFTINSKTVASVDPATAGWNSFSGFESYTGDTFVEIAELKYSNNLNALGGIFIKPSSYYNHDNLSISLNNLTSSINDLYFTKDSSTLIGNFTFNGVDYTQVYLFDSFQYQLYFSINSGFIKIDEIDNSGNYNDLFTIVD